MVIAILAQSERNINDNPDIKHHVFDEKYQKEEPQKNNQNEFGVSNIMRNPY